VNKEMPIELEGDRDTGYPADLSKEVGAALDDLPFNRRHYLVFGVCAAGFLFDSLDFQIMAVAAPSIAKEWQLSPGMLGTVFSAAQVGMLVGSIVFGILCDQYGRRTIFQVTVGIFAAFSGLCAAAQSLMQLAALRLAAGLGIGGFVPVDTSVLAEFMPTRHRGRMLALIALFYPVGGLLAAACASLVMPTLGWRGLFLIGVIPALMIFLVRWLVPETPRYLLQVGKLPEAEKSVQWISSGRVSLPKKAHSQVHESAVQSQQKKLSVLELLSKEYRARTIMLWGLWFAWSFTYFGLIMWLPTLLVKYRDVPQTEVFYYMMGFMLSGIIGRIFVVIFVDRVGRVPILVLYGTCAGILLFLFGQQTGLTNLMIYGYITAFFHDGGLSAMGAYTPELYPTRARATGYGWAAGVGRAASILAPMVVGILLTSYSIYSVFVVFGVSYIAAALIVLAFRIETKGLQLETASLEAVAGSGSAPFSRKG
jgi:MFS transporter, putative metabolite:H+ symporter